MKRDIEAVITSYNQGNMILEAVRSVCSQTLLPERIIIVDDGSTDKESLAVLGEMKNSPDFPVPVIIQFQENQGVSAARNTGIRSAHSSMVLVLDGDDRIEKEYIEKVYHLLLEHPSMVIASSWMRTFGTLDAIVRPSGGNIVPFLSHNCCPATHILRKKAFERCGGYDESMRSGFEDWDFFLSMLETAPDAHAGIVEKPLIQYRTSPVSANIKSMEKRRELMRYLIQKHFESYHSNLADVLLDMEAISDFRLSGWENEMVYSMEKDQELSESATDFMKNPSYGDGGMAAAVRIASARKPISLRKGNHEKMQLREYIPSDVDQLAELFHQTVHSVNGKDYSTEQLHAWANGEVDLQEWNRSFLEHYTIVAVENDRIVGFGDIDRSGYLDRLYVHKDHQRKGIASAICDKLEQQAGKQTITTHASITARPFFEHRGYRVIRRQKVVRSGIELTNYVMEK